MKKIFFLVLLAAVLAACSKNSYNAGKTLVEVNGKKITEGYLQFLSDINPNFARQLSSPFGQQQILNSLIEQELLYQASEKEGIDHDPTVKAKIDLYRKVILAQAYVESVAAKEAKKYYDEHQKEFEKLKLSHIMVAYASPEEIKAAKKVRRKGASLRAEPEALKAANEIYDRIQKGAKFDEQAKKFSDDIATKELGGDLGGVSKEDPKLTRRGFAPLIEKAFTMKVGEIAGPVKTTAGYHIITVTQPAEQAAFDEVKGFLLFKTRGDMREKVLAQLKEKNKVVYAEGFQPPPATPDSAPHLHPEGETGEHPHN